MSENEKKRRLEYRKKRRRLLIIQSVIAVFLGLAIVAASVVYFTFNANSYVNYTEQSTIDYKVYLKPNNEYEDDYLGKDQSYIASIVDYVYIDFGYRILLDSEWANYSANYAVDAKLTIKDDTNKKAIYTHDYPLVANTNFVSGGNNELLIVEQISVDYDQYNDFATNFKNIYNLSNVSCYLDVTMRISTTGECAEIGDTDFGSCSFSLNIPLTKQTIEINMLSSIPQGKQSSITCESCVNRNIFKYVAFGAAGLEILVLFIILVYAYSTRNHDINYEIKIKRLVSAYKSYIQKIINEFCYDGYQLVMVETFNQMLDIRDTINSPILMSENADKTCTTFLIPTNNGILYVHEIKVEDYDEIYGINNQQEIVDAVIENASILEDTDDLAATELEDAGFTNRVSYDYSFQAKLHLSNEFTREFYQEISSFVQSYGLKVNRSWNKERIQIGKKTYAILSFKGLKLVASFALNPADYQDTKYKLVDVSETKKFAQVPAQMKVTSARKANWVKELLGIMLEQDGVENMNLNVEVQKIRAKTKKKLIKEKLIKIK